MKKLKFVISNKKDIDDGVSKYEIEEKDVNDLEEGPLGILKSAYGRYSIDDDQIIENNKFTGLSNNFFFFFIVLRF